MLASDHRQQRLIVEEWLVARIGPEDGAVGVDDEGAVQQQFRLACGLGAERAVLLSHAVVLVGQDGEKEPTVFGEPLGGQIDGIATDRHDARSHLDETRQVFVQAEQLPDAMIAVVAVVEDEDHGAIVQQGFERDNVAAVIRQREIRSHFAE